MNQSLLEKISSTLSPISQLSWLVDLQRRFAGASFFVVGGTVRDAVLGRPLGDLDLVATGVLLDDLLTALQQLGQVDVVGRDFGVIKFVPTGESAQNAVDIALPRTERSRGTGGYRDVAIHTDPSLPITEDLARRDFTINALAWNVGTGELVDPFSGLADCQSHTLRAVGDPELRFQEDVTRVLRGLRFAATLNFNFEAATWQALVAAVSKLTTVVASETIADELLRAFAANPVIAINNYDRSGALFQLIPELIPTQGCEQPKNFHSEGDVWPHTKLAVAALQSPAFQEFFPHETASPRAVLATLFHDIAKPDTAAIRDGKLTFHGHSELGAEKTQTIAERLKFSSASWAGIDPASLAWLVKMHLVPNSLDLSEVRPATLHKHFLADPVLGRDLLHLAYADAAATIHEDGITDHANLRAVKSAIEKIASEHGTGEPKLLLTGDEIMQLLHLTSGPAVGKAKAALWEAQLSGQIVTKDDAERFISSLSF